MVTTYLAGGLIFSISLIFILGTHEFGHYWASRRNRVRATLPYFMPAPPIFIGGTMGAFIRIQDPIPDRRVLMEIGASGPIAGFIVGVPVLIIGLFLSDVSNQATSGGLSFGNSLILNICSQWILGVNPGDSDVNIMLHPMAFAGWIGMFVTALNLIPIGQLDGGHILSSLFRERFSLLAKIFYALLFPLGYFWMGWWIWALLITLLGFQPAPLLDESEALERKHKVLGWGAMVILCLTFVPVPFEVF